MSKKLILFTQDFPFEKGETFLETELPFLEAAFDEILIVSTSLHQGFQLTRKVSTNTKSLPLVRPSGRAKKLWGLLNGVAHTDKTLLTELNGQKSLKKKITVAYFYGRYSAVYSQAKGKIMSFIGNITNETRVTFYSYWFIETAQVAVSLAKEICEKGGHCRTCTRAHGFDLYESRNAAGLFPFRESVIEQIDYVYPCSMDGERYLKEKYPSVKFKIHTRYLGTKDHGLNPDGEQNPIIIVTCSYLTPVKRLDVFAEALSLYDTDDQMRRIRWICIGDGAEKGKLEAIAAKYQHVETQFVGAWKNSEVLEWYGNNHIDLFVNTSSSEGLPVSIMEACSFGIPVLATDVGGTKEIVVNGVNGVLIDEKISPESLFDELKNIIDSGTLSQYRKAARQVWMNNFNADANYDLFARELAEIEE